MNTERKLEVGGAAIRIAMQKQNVSPKKLVDETRYDQSAVSRAINGKESIACQESIARILGIEDELYSISIRTIMNTIKNNWIPNKIYLVMATMITTMACAASSIIHQDIEYGIVAGIVCIIGVVNASPIWHIRRISEEDERFFACVMWVLIVVLIVQWVL